MSEKRGLPPVLAHDTQGTISAAKRLWKEVDRPNLMIKIPGTVEGGPAITEAIARKPKGHDFIIDRRHTAPAVRRHMSVTGG